MIKLKVFLGKYYFQCIWLLISCIYTLLRLPSLFLKHFSLDEGYYIAMGWDLNNGQNLYQQTWDRKPPLIYWLYSWLLNISGNQYWIIPVTNFVLGFITIVLIYLIARRFLNEKLSFLSTFIAALVLGFPTLESHIFNGENLFLPFTLAGVWLFLRSIDWGNRTGNPEFKEIFQTILAGIFWSIATLTKAHPGVELIGFLIGFILVCRYNLKYAFSKILLALLPILTVWTVVIIHFHSKGYLDWAIYSIFQTNSDYIDQQSREFATFLTIPLYNGKDYIPDQQGITSLIWRSIVLGFSSITLAYVSLKALAIKSADKIFANKPMDLVVNQVDSDRKEHLSKLLVIFTFWTAYAIFASFLSGRNYSHYLLQLVPHFAISITLFISILWQNWTKLVPQNFSAKWHSVIAGLTIVLVFWQYIVFIFGGGSFYLSFDAYPVESYYRNFYWEASKGNVVAWQDKMFTKKVWFYPVDKMVQAIDQNSSPNDRIWTYTNFPALAFYAKRPSGYLAKTWFDVDDKTRPRILEEFAKEPPKLILWDNTEKNDLTLKTYIMKNYTLKTYVLDMFDQTPRYEIWVLK
jgi:4-amino-4-deoxy-L-arabinose transferase-like glycosyltransferase